MRPTDGLRPCDRVRIAVLDENYIDMLLPDTPTIRRLGMRSHFDHKVGTPLAENGISFYVEVTLDGSTHAVLLDAGFTSQVVLHNASLLGIDLGRIDHVVLSHGHPDHFGGLEGVLRAIGHPVPLAVHPDAFDPRYIVQGSGNVMPYINLPLTRERLEAAGAGLVLSRTPLRIAPGVMTSGTIERCVSFEKETPGGRLCVRGGEVVEDAIEDHQALIVHVRGRGLVVLDTCGHAGVISSLMHARKVSGVADVFAVMGGFHLGHIGISAEKVDRTVEQLAALGVRFIAPMHCSGFRTLCAVATRLPDAFQLLTAGSIVTFEGGAEP